MIVSIKAEFLFERKNIALEFLYYQSHKANSVEGGCIFVFLFLSLSETSRAL